MSASKTVYDFAFSLGASCASTQALRAAKMQFASLPFDWTAGGDIVGRAGIVAAGFRDWMRMEDLRLTDVIHATYNSSIYRNSKTGLVYSHDFPAGCYLEDEFPSVSETLQRRVARLNAEIEKSRRVLAVYSEIPYRAVAADDDLVKAQQLLQARFPGVRIDLLYFAQDPDGVDHPEVVLNDNVTKVVLDYHSMDCGFVGLTPRFRKMVPFLLSHYEVKDPRTREQIAAYEQAERDRDRRRWGAGLQRWVNRRFYHLYRRLEVYLVRQGCIPDSRRPLKLYPERGERCLALRAKDLSFLPKDGDVMRRAYDLL